MNGIWDLAGVLVGVALLIAVGFYFWRTLGQMAAASASSERTAALRAATHWPALRAAAPALGVVMTATVFGITSVNELGPLISRLLEMMRGARSLFIGVLFATSYSLAALFLSRVFTELFHLVLDVLDALLARSRD